MYISFVHLSLGVWSFLLIPAAISYRRSNFGHLIRWDFRQNDELSNFHFNRDRVIGPVADGAVAWLGLAANRVNALETKHWSVWAV